MKPARKPKGRGKKRKAAIGNLGLPANKRNNNNGNNNPNEPVQHERESGNERNESGPAAMEMVETPPNHLPQEQNSQEAVEVPPNLLPQEQIGAVVQQNGTTIVNTIKTVFLF